MLPQYLSTTFQNCRFEKVLRFPHAPLCLGMKTPRFLRFFLVRGLLGAVLFCTPAFAISKEDLAVLRAKAESGNGIAQYNLGLLYATLSEPLADPIEAYVWFNLAADNGATGRALVLLSSQMNTEQVAEAKHRLEVRRAELEAKKKNPANASASPVSAAETSPSNPDSSSPIVAAPSLPEPPISAAPLNERDFASLQAEIKKMSSELSAAWKENEQLKAAQAKGNQTSTMNDQLHATLATTNEEVAKLRSQVAGFAEERNTLQQKIAAAGQAQKDGIAAELATVSGKLRAAESQLAQAALINGELATAKQALASQSDQLQKLSAENQRLASVAAQTAATTDSKMAAEKELSALRTELSTAQAQLAAAKTETANSATAQKQITETQSKLDSTLHSLEEQQKEAAQLKQALANADSEHTSFAKQVAELKTASGKPNAALEQRIAQLTTDLQTARLAEIQMSQLQTQLSQSQTKLKSAENNLARSNQDKDQLDKQLATVKAAPVPAPGDIIRLNTELSDTRGRLAAAEQALAHTKEDHDRAAQEATRAAQQQIAQLTSQLQQLQQKSAASNEALATATRERDSLRQQLGAAVTSTNAAADTAAVEARLKSAEEALATSNAERAALAERLSTAEKKATAVASVMGAGLPTMGEDPAALRKELDETQGKLTAALRTYQLQQDELDRVQKSLVNIDAERAQLADRLHQANTQATQVQVLAMENQTAVAQLAAVREQFRQAQNQIASLGGENAQLKNRLALSSPAPGSTLVTGTSSPSHPAGLVSPTTPAVTRPMPSAPTRPAAPPAPRTHTVSEGDTLSKIARHYYGSSDRWPQILEANRSAIKDVNNLTVGSTLKIP